MGRTAIAVTISLLGLLFQPGASRAEEAATDRLQYPLAPSKLTFRPRGGSVRFKAQWSGARGTTFNPKAVGSAVAITADGQTATTALDAAKWRTLKKNRGFRYRSRDGAVRSIEVRMRKEGGSIEIGASLTGQPATNIGVVLTIGPARWCSEFAGPFRRKRGHMVAVSKTGPATCPCAGGSASTWSSIQTTIIDRYGCTNAACHGNTPSESNGFLELSPDVAYANLVGVPSSRLPNLERVKMADRTHSLFWLKLAMKTAPDEFASIASRLGITSTAGSGMPLNEFKLAPDELEAVRLWIQNGAPETGVVPGTAELLSACLPPPDPIKIAAPPVPAASDGVQFYAPPWPIAPRNTAGLNGEAEICHATYYDFSDRIPPEMKLSKDDPRCAYWGGDRDCFFFNKAELTQDPNSHHSIIHIYRGKYAAGSPEWLGGFGPFTCRAGERVGQPCDPLGASDQCPGSQCAGRVQGAPACFFYGPDDFQATVNGDDGGSTAPTIGGSQQPYSERDFPAGVFGIYPVKGTMIWNSHAFNVTDRPATNEQYYNVYFAKTAADRRDIVRVIFDARYIFSENVPPFEQREYCNTFTLPQGARLTDLSSHTHKRGVRFRIWTPPNAPCAGLAGCPPDETRPPLITTTIYNDPIQYFFDGPEGPVALDDADPASRSIRYCSLYDNGFRDPATVKRKSTSPPVALGGPCGPATVACLDGPHKGELCHDDNHACDSTPGANDGRCDACPLRGGISTEDEMFILLGGWYLPHCSDGVKNYDESDVDCGGACDGCAPGQACSVETDCRSDVCTNAVCEAAATQPQ